MKMWIRYISLFLLTLICFGCDINKYDLEKIDVINFSNLFNEGPSLKRSDKSGLIQNLDNNSYYVSAVTTSNQLGVFHISEIGEFIAFHEIGIAEENLDFIKVGSSFYLLANEASYARIYQLSTDFTILNEISFEDLVDNTDILSVKGYDLFFDSETDDIYISGICTRNNIGDQMMVMRVDLNLEQVWPNPKKYFDVAPAYSIASYNSNQLVISGIKKDESPFFVRMARTGNLLGNIILLEDLGIDSFNSIQVIDTSIFVSGSSIDINPQAIVAQYSFEDLNVAVQNTSFGVGCNPLLSTSYHQFRAQDGDLVAIADNRNLNEIQITKYDPFSPSLSWNQCYPNLDGAIDIQSLAGIQTKDRTFAFASMESLDGTNYFLRLIKTDIQGDVRF